MLTFTARNHGGTNAVVEGWRVRRSAAVDYGQQPSLCWCAFALAKLT